MPIKNLRTVTPSIAQQLAEFVNTPKDEIYDKIVKYFLENPNPDDFDIHKFAEENEMSPAEMEGLIYDLLTNFIRTIGRHNDVPDSMFFKDQLEMGIKEEMEHTDSQYLAKLIAKDHLSQDPLYYSHHDIEESRFAEMAADYDPIQSKKDYLNHVIKSSQDSIEHLDTMKKFLREKIHFMRDQDKYASQREKAHKDIEKYNKKQETLRDKIARAREQLRKLNEKIEKDKELNRRKRESSKE